MTFRMHLREQRTVERADTAQELQALNRESFLASVYELDWDSEPVLKSRALYTKRDDVVRRAALEEERASVLSYVEALERRNLRPERLLCLTMAFTGTLIYPVFNGEIRLRANRIPYETFAPVLNKRRVTTSRL